MKSTDPKDTRQTIARNIAADAIVRAVQWLCFTAIVAGMGAPLAWDAVRERGVMAGLAVFALVVMLAWSVRPHGRSYGAQVREIERDYSPPE